MLDYAALAKPELTFLSVVTAVAGFLLGSRGLELTGLIHLTFGTSLAGAACGALNQYLEREHDARMHRTARRPLPGGRIAPRTALFLGLLFAAGGTAHLWHFLGPLPGLLSAATLASYLLVYTPLKRHTHHATLVGGIPGALPPVIGWGSATGELGPTALLLFALLFLWQMPHFHSLAWIYRNDYARAGYPLLAVIDADGSRTGMMVAGFTLALLPVSLLAPLAGHGGVLYLAGASILGLAFLVPALRFRSAPTAETARHVFFASLLYLPSLLLLLVLS
jgi:protoheme IX farnesyltransferase